MLCMLQPCKSFRSDSSKDTVPSCSDEKFVSLHTDVGRPWASSGVTQRPIRTAGVNECRTKTTCHQLGHVDEYHRHQQTEHESTWHSRHVTVTSSFHHHGDRTNNCDKNGPATQLNWQTIQFISVKLQQAASCERALTITVQAQLSQRDRATRCLGWNPANCWTTVRKNPIWKVLK